MGMPNDLLTAHRKLDAAVDRQVTGAVRSGQGARLPALLKAYQALSGEQEVQLANRGSSSTAEPE